MKPISSDSLLPVLCLTVATFTYGTSELMPIGLLTDIAGGFDITESQAGMLVTIYAWCVAILSLPLMLACAKMEHRRLLLWLIGIFTLGNGLSSLAPTFGTLLASRFIVALSHAVFWSVVPVFAVGVYPGHNSTKAIGMIAAGESVAMVAGMPVGRTIGLMAGWRMSFGAVALTALVLFGLLWFIFPKQPGVGADHSRKEMVRDIATNPALRAIYLVTALLVTGQYTAYSYIEPFLARVGGMDPELITVTLSIFGIAGIMASYLMSRMFPRHPRAILGGITFAVCAFVLGIVPAAHLGTGALMADCLLWGCSLTMFSIAYQDQIIRFTPAASSSVAMSVFSGIFNVGIGAGALIGGIAVAGHGVQTVPVCAAAIILLAALAALLFFLPHRPRP